MVTADLDSECGEMDDFYLVSSADNGTVPSAAAPSFTWVVGWGGATWVARCWVRVGTGGWGGVFLRAGS